MAKYLSMKFKNELNDSGMVRLDYIKDDLNDEQVKAAVTAIVDNKVLVGKKGVLDQAVQARVVETTYQDFSIL
ncbi:DUF2922 domain-containing protein [Mediannikoviicoccus vaginalis]|uniref:DUF2922 domain-containing protein n=1 Tax=Mediannikoviicoccus vaginalis TaxID=2899727 RepID=UPI001F23770B|nr:DUF2922 domain-containing protein [Mediannikoviicoccus vaginalis]